MKPTRHRSGPKAFQIFKNFSFLTIGKTLGDAFTFLLFVVLSRVFGQDGIGQYSFAMALTGFFVVFSDFGLYPFTVKEMSRRTISFEDYYGRIFSLRLILSAAIFGVLLLVLSFLPFPYETKLIIAVIGAYQVISRVVEGIGAIFVAREDTHLAGLIEASSKAIAALAGIAVVMAGGSLVTSLAILPTVALGTLFVTYWLMTIKYGRPNLVLFSSSLRHVMREAIPYALSLFLFQLYSRVDVVILGFFFGATAAGIYNVGYRVVFFLMFIPQLAAMAIFPTASRLYLDSMKDLKSLYRKGLNLIILIGVPAASGLFLISPNLINLIFGKSFEESATVLRILCGLLFLACLNRIIGVFMMSCDRQVERTRCQWKAACVNVLGNLLLIPIFGFKGAAVTALISETLLIILFAIQLKPVLGLPRIGSRLAISGLGTASFCFTFSYFPSDSLMVVILLSILLYLGTLVFFKDIRRNEIRMVLSLLKFDHRRVM